MAAKITAIIARSGKRRAEVGNAAPIFGILICPLLHQPPHLRRKIKSAACRVRNGSKQALERTPNSELRKDSRAGGFESGSIPEQASGPPGVKLEESSMRDEIKAARGLVRRRSSCSR